MPCPALHTVLVLWGQPPPARAGTPKASPACTGSAKPLPRDQVPLTQDVRESPLGSPQGAVNTTKTPGEPPFCLHPRLQPPSEHRLCRCGGAPSEAAYVPPSQWGGPAGRLVWFQVAPERWACCWAEGACVRVVWAQTAPREPCTRPRGSCSGVVVPALSPSSSEPPDLAGGAAGGWTEVPGSPPSPRAAWPPPLQCWGARACAQPFWLLCGSCSHCCPRLCPHAPVSPRGRESGRPPGGSGCSQSWGEAGGPWWRRVPLGLTGAPGVHSCPPARWTLAKSGLLGPTALPGCPAHRASASARMPML